MKQSQYNQIVKFFMHYNDHSEEEIKEYCSQFLFKEYPYSYISNFKKLDNIGEGLFSKVYKVEEIYTLKVYAAKSFVFIINDFPKFLNHLNILYQISHPYIQKFIGYSLYDLNNKINPTIFTQYYKNGSLKDILELIRKGEKIEFWNDKTKFSIIYKISCALSYLHNKGIVHRDLKPSNILLNDQLEPIICDLGCSKQFSQITEEENDQFFGTPLYLAPENWKGIPYSTKSDVYAFGLIMYEILIGTHPFANLDVIQIGYQVAVLNETPIIKDQIPDIYKEIINSCLDKDPTKRPSFNEIATTLGQYQLGKSAFINSLCQEECNCFIYSSGFNNCNGLNEDFLDLIDELKILKIDLNEYQKLRKIGHGGFGNVYLIRHKRTKQLFAAKKIITNTNKKYDFLNELRINSEIKNPLIAKLIGYSLHDFNNEPSMIIITEYVANGSLERILDNERHNIVPNVWNETMKLITIYRIASAIQYLHSKGILHLDIKPSNILLDKFLLSKICDFGSSQTIGSDQLINSETIGTFSFISPEIITGGIRTTKSDVYSFGMLLYEIKSNKYPFEGQSAGYIIKKITTGKRPILSKSIPEIYRKLIKSCWNHDPDKRPSFEYILNDLRNNKEYITDGVDESLYLSYIDIIDDELKGIDITSKLEKLFIKYNLDDFYKNNIHESSNINTSYSSYSINTSTSTNQLCQIIGVFNNKINSYCFHNEKIQKYKINNPNICTI